MTRTHASPTRAPFFLLLLLRARSPPPLQEMSDEYKAAQARLMLAQAAEVDVIVTTALIPGRQAPVLVNQEMLDVMRPGSVLVDLAAANGGNVAQTEKDKVVTTENGVTIIGYTDLPSRLASTSSTLVSAPCPTEERPSRFGGVALPRTRRQCFPARRLPL